MLFLLSLLQSFVYQFATIKIESKYGFFLDEQTKSHAIHKFPTPRVGGIGIFLAFAVTTLSFMPDFWWLVLGSGVVFFFGLYEDWHGDTSKLARLFFMAAGTIIAVYFGGYVADNSEFFVLPYYLAVIFTIFAIVGMCSAINFIDGLNGLAGGLSAITLLFFAILSFIYDGSAIYPMSMILIGALFGFLMWNYPGGKIFLGDGGAYFLGFILGMFAVILSARHEEISLWYSLLALSYPVIETFVTIERRIKRKRKKSIPFFEAEKVHLHTLKYRRLTRDNPMASNRLLFFHLLINLVAFALHKYVFALIVCFFIVYVIYMVKYRRIIRFGRVL